MAIEKLTEKDYRAVLDLSQYAFQYQISEDEMAEALDELKAHHLLGIFEGDHLAAKLHLVPFEIQLEDIRIKMGGIGAVATYPEYRRNGYVKTLIQETLSLMKEEGFLISMLHPFNVNFYRKFGWELFCDQRRSTLTRYDLKPIGQASGSVKRYKKESHPEEVNAIYQVYSKRYAGMVVRTQKRWLDAVYKDFTAAVYFNGSGEPKGYLLYKVINSQMTVGEFVPLDQDARIGLWNFICQHDSMVEELEIVTDVKDPLFFLLPEPRVKTSVKPYAMARIVDVVEFLKTYPFHWEQSISSVTLKISDDMATWNNVTVQLDHGKVEVVSPNTADRSSTIELDIKALTTAMMGYQTPTDLHQIEKLKAETEAVKNFEGLIGKHTPQLLDFF